jgi:DSF synthase
LGKTEKRQMAFVETMRSAAPGAGWHPRIAVQGGATGLPAPSANLDIALDLPAATLWSWMRPQGRPCFSPALLAELRGLQSALAELPEDAPALRHVVTASALPGIYNLGGDLALFAELIAARDLASLRRYGLAAVEAIHASHTAFGQPVVTIALVQGDALGGGFECALAHDVIVAERGARFGLPEVLFNLFPGMGAYSFLSRRIGRVAAERMILSGTIHTAAELHAMGIVDVLAEDGEGEVAARDWIARTGRRFNAHRSVFAARRRVDPVTLQELRDVVEDWARAALRLEPADLRKMQRLAAAQDRRIAAAG